VWIEKSEVGTNPTLNRSFSLVVLATWDVPQGVPCFVNGGSRTTLDYHHTCAAASSDRAELGLGPRRGGNKSNIGYIALFGSVYKDQSGNLGCARTSFCKQWTMHYPWLPPSRIGPALDLGLGDTFFFSHEINYLFLLVNLNGLFWPLIFCLLGINPLSDPFWYLFWLLFHLRKTTRK
jgi:hypothetical protein